MLHPTIVAFGLNIPAPTFAASSATSGSGSVTDAGASDALGRSVAITLTTVVGHSRSFQERAFGLTAPRKREAKL